MALIGVILETVLTGLNRLNRTLTELMRARGNIDNLRRVLNVAAYI